MGFVFITSRWQANAHMLLSTVRVALATPAPLFSLTVLMCRLAAPVVSSRTRSFPSAGMIWLSSRSR
ncbi:hypothetical protein FrEUN1fDRAFT_7672 [Parafrankia sp. EUN1f]|nr:hypothetical protein FrEUN1fDRAFT_7672 [Parafrankia sp. EUN1f]